MSAVVINAETEAKVREILVNSLDLEGEELTMDGLFVEDYGADSLGAIEVLSALEKTFDVTIEQEEMQRMVNLATVLDILSRAAAR
ncbi:acyl carrier protein [Streptomyces sp. SB3404]|uniref:Acyl carrier protein n=2 Tax=Streptomyces boncukensis TaxID=2711219 RepID=A0A6G4X427_9ACTN|nr:acyl carrier protein [Streptomyces boncukensis]